MIGGGRRGFALLLVLWMLVGVAALAATIVSAERYALASSTNRVLLERGSWSAEGCIERARAAIDDTLRAPPAAAGEAWWSLDTVLMASRLTTGCHFEARPAGAVLNVNSATREELILALQSSGVRPEQADSITDAILDWEDPDDLPRASGGEATWYRAKRLLVPRNGPIAARGELSRVRGVALVPGIDSLLDVEPGRILIGRAQSAVLAALPGFGPEAAARAASFSSGTRPRDLAEFTTMLTPQAREEMMAHFADLQSRIAFSPDAWIVTARAFIGQPSVGSALEVRLVRAGRRVAITRRRSWP